MQETLEPPTFLDVLDASRRIRPHLRLTALHSYPELSRLFGADVWVKHENHGRFWRPTTCRKRADCRRPLHIRLLVRTTT